MDLVKKFFETSYISRNKDTEDMVAFIASPESVAKMMIASDLKLPALAGIVKELELKFSDCEKAPLNHTGEHQNMVHRQNVGRIIKFVMGEFGYIPVDGKLSERARLPKAVESKHFSTSAVYEKKYESNKRVEYSIVEE